MTERPIVVSIGDVGGIAPEILWKFVTQSRSFPPLLVPAPFRLFEMLEKKYRLSRGNYHVIESVRGTRWTRNRVYLLPVKANIVENDVASGRAVKRAAELAIESLRKGMELCREGIGKALLTLPVHKKMFSLAGEKEFSGHTEYLMKGEKKRNVVMMMTSPEITVVPLTRHLPLRRVADTINGRLLSGTLKIVDEFYRVRKLRYRSAVLSLNPHRGEGGLCGKEEKWMDRIVNRLSEKGYPIFGTFSPDAFFGRQGHRKFNVIFGWYHDQVLIPFKLLSMGKGVNVTLGLPYIRVSVDHGCGYDIAPYFKADPSSLSAAVTYIEKNCVNV